MTIYPQKIDKIFFYEPERFGLTRTEPEPEPEPEPELQTRTRTSYPEPERGPNV